MDTPRSFKLLIIVLLSLIVLIFTPQAGYTQTATLDLEWTPNNENNLAGYKVHYGISPGLGTTIVVNLEDAGLSCDSSLCSFELSGLVLGKTYYVALTAYDTSGNESARSNVESEAAHLPTTPTTTSTTTPGLATTTTPGSATTTTPASVTTTIRFDEHPNSTVIINNGDKTTQLENVTLTLYATDKDGNEIGKDALIKISNDNQEWSDPKPYRATKTWTLSPGEGDKTVFVKFGDAADNWTLEVQDQIILVGPQKQLKPVSILSSSEFAPFWGKDNVSDGDLLTYWSSLLAFFWENESITLDLGEVKLIDSVNMYAIDFFYTCYFPVNFQIEISKDKIDWEELYTVRNYAPKPAKSDSWNINSYEGRYIKVYITKAKIFFFFFYLTQIAEIEVYGYDLPEEQQSIKPDDTPLVTPGEASKEEKEGETPGEEAGVVQGLPGVPGTPLINF